MDFTELLSEKIESASTTIGAINAFSEFVSSKFTDLANFIAGTGEYASVYFQEGNNSVVSKLGRLSNDVYQNAIQEPDQMFSIPISDSTGIENTIQLTGQDIVAAVDEQVANLRCQEQFVNYCLSVETTSVSDFITRVKAVAPGISGAILEKFSRLIEISGSPIDCLQSFFIQYSTSKVTYENQRISLVNVDDYVGNIWESAWTIVTDTVGSFFANVWQGITDIGGFFQRLLNGILSFGKWIVSHAFSDLATAYEKGCNASIGIMDLPLFQVVGSVEEWKTFFDTMGAASGIAYSLDRYNHCWHHQTIASYMKESFENLIIDSFDGVNYDSVCEVVVPSRPHDISLRLGRLSDGRVCLSAYVISDYGTWSQRSDAENNSDIYYSLYYALSFISSVIPMGKNKLTSPSDMDKFYVITDLFINQGALETDPLPSLLRHLNQEVSTLTPDSLEAYVMAALPVYMCAMSKGFVMIQDGVLQDVTNQILQYDIFNTTSNIYPLDEYEATFLTPLDRTYLDTSVFGASSFKPYAKRNQLPVTIHYQTRDEQAAEILGAVLKVVISTVAVVATVKFLKWSKRRKKEAILNHANVDRLSWDVAANPTAENRAAFTKAWRKARNADFINSLLGIGVGSAGDAVSTAIGTMSNMLGVTSNSSDAIITLIKG